MQAEISLVTLSKNDNKAIFSSVKINDGRVVMEGWNLNSSDCAQLQFKYNLKC